MTYLVVYLLGVPVAWMVWGWTLLLRYSWGLHSPADRDAWWLEFVGVVVWPITLGMGVVAITLVGVVSPIIGYLEARDSERDG